MKLDAKAPIRFQAVGCHNVSKMPEWKQLEPDLREPVEVVARVLPFRTNQYLMENLIDWSKVPNDPIFWDIIEELDNTDLDQRLVKIEKNLEQIWVLLEKVLRTLEQSEAVHRTER